MVILVEQQTVARNPLLVTVLSELNLTVMVVAVTCAGREEPENVWVEDPSVISTMSESQLYPISNAANVSVTGSPFVDSSLHSYNIIFNIFIVDENDFTCW